jgi:hypothetical protein
MGKPAETDRPSLRSLNHSFTLDSNIYVQSLRAGQRVLASVTRFLERRLKLTVNAAKSAVDRPWRRTFLGFTFTRRRPNRRQVSEKALKALKQEVRQWTGRTRGVPLQRVVQDLRQDLEGWYGSFRFAEGQSIQESSSVGGESCFHPYRRVARHV